MTIAVMIRPTIPDNEGRTAFSTLRRLRVPITGLERAMLLLIEDDLDPAAVAKCVRADETIFNENTHSLSVRRAERPEAGEIWVGDDRGDIVEIPGLGPVRRLTAWTMRSSSGPADASTLQVAAESLLCHPAVQHVVVDAASEFRHVSRSSKVQPTS